MTKELKVIFQPSGRNVFVLPGTPLVEAAARAGLVVAAPCGGAGKCGKCVVRVLSREPPAEVSSHEEALLGKKRLQHGNRLACQFRVTHDMTVEVPDSSLFSSGHKILAEHAKGAKEVKPSVTGRRIKLKTHDMEGLKAALGAVEIAPSHLPLPASCGREIVAVIADNRLVDIRPADSARKILGVAFDIGTTTLVGTLLDLANGDELALTSTINPQTSYGDDVISRIKKCREEKDGLDQLNDAVMSAVNTLVGKLASEAKVETRDIFFAVFAGNTAMQEILCRIDPAALGEIPFTPAFLDPLRMSVANLGLEINPYATAFVFPQIGGFVGGDTVAGIISTRLDEAVKPTLLVDVGTNGEIVLSHKGKLLATSVAAGPAFEGARIRNGMRAANGAIEKVLLADGDLELNVIGDTAPAGLCGTGLIDAVAELLRAGVIDSTGRIRGRDELPATAPPALRERIVEGESHNDFMLADGPETASGEKLCLYQKDIRELQLANGAIRTGINILLKMEGLAPSDLDSVMLAGAFGNFIRRNNARRIGMLPAIPCERIRFVGNTASFGAKRVLLSTAEAEYAAAVARKTHHVDLSLNPEFQNEFSSAMIFPESESEPACE